MQDSPTWDLIVQLELELEPACAADVDALEAVNNERSLLLPQNKQSQYVGVNRP